jgi:hypothetical protein
VALIAFDDCGSLLTSVQLLRHTLTQCDPQLARKNSNQKQVYLETDTHKCATPTTHNCGELAQIQLGGDKLIIQIGSIEVVALARSLASKQVPARSRNDGSGGPQSAASVCPPQLCFGVTLASFGRSLAQPAN